MMSSAYGTADMYKNSSISVELEMDMQVKSEIESDNDSCDDSAVSVSSSLEEVPVSRLTKYQSDEEFEELEEEPLIEIDAITVPQELVEVELEPSLLLFVNRESKQHTSSKNSQASVEEAEATKIKSVIQISEEEVANRKAITKALRNVKRKHQTPKQNCVKLYENKIEISETSNKESLNKINSSDALLSPCNSSPKIMREKVNMFPTLPSNRKSKSKNIRKHVKLKTQKIIHQTMEKENMQGKNKLVSEEKEWNSLLNSLIDDSLLPSLSNVNEKESSITNAEPEEKENSYIGNEEKIKQSILKADNDHSVSLNKNVKSCKRIQKHVSYKENKKAIQMIKPESFDCTVCGKKFREKSHLATHSRAHIDIRNYKCNECGNQFKTKTNLFFHMKTHEEAPFICKICNKTYPERKMLMRHIRVVHSGEGNYNCDQCGRSFKSAHNLDLHYTLHTGNKPFSCNICGKSFVYKSTYIAHKKAHEADDSFNCELCPSNIIDKGELRRRCNHHSEARPWLCTVCGKGYPLKGTLKNHMKTHEPEKPFKCNECGKSFMKKQSYECHMKIHAGENPQYMCDQCSQSYFNVFALKRHYMKHTSERRFICDICNKAFWMKDALKVHKRSHASLKMFQCTQCTKAFAHKHTLVAHLRTHSSEQSYSCTVCSKTFIHKYNLDRHERQHSIPPMPPLPPPPPVLPLPPSLIMMAPPKHIDLPTLHIL